MAIGGFEASQNAQIFTFGQFHEIQHELGRHGIEETGTVRELKMRLTNHQEAIARQHQRDHANTDVLQLDQSIYPCHITSAADDMLVFSSDVLHSIHTISLIFDGVLVKGETTRICAYPAGCLETCGIFVSRNIVYFSCRGDLTGIAKASLESGVCTTLMILMFLAWLLIQLMAMI